MTRLSVDPSLPVNPQASKRYLDDLRFTLDRVLRNIASQLNRLTEGDIAAVTNAYTSQPTTGTWKQGDFIRNSAPSEAGAGGSKYVILGWIRITSGSANVLNTDWVALRCLTGN